MQQISRLTLRLTRFLSLSYAPKFSTVYQIHTGISSPKNQMVYNYLIDNFKVPESKALTVSNRCSSAQTLEKPQSVVKHLKALGFTDIQIISSANVNPEILFTNVDRTLKPKLHLLGLELGLSGPNLGTFISKNAYMLRHSFDKRLKPVIDVIRSILRKHNSFNANRNDNIHRVLSRCSYLIYFKDSHKRLLANVSLLESCGIVNSQLAKLLIRTPRLFYLRESKLQRLISRVLNLGLSCDSRMFVYGLHTMNGISEMTFLRKLKLFSSFGLTEDECMVMFRKQPAIFRLSDDKLRAGLSFFLNTLVMERLVFIRYIYCLTYSMEVRVLARYRVIKLLESKMILKEGQQFITTLFLSEEAFIEKYISRFPAHAEDLMFQYKGHLIDSISH